MKAQSNFSKRPKTKKQLSGSTGEIRIISGQWKGRRLKVHDKEGLRPTTDRLKETLFNWLMMDIRNSRVLDCFAGAGALGFEAVSRGATSLICIEKDKKAANQLKSNCKLLQADTQITVKHGDFFTEVKRLSEQFDLVFIDPPFHKDMTNKCVASLIENELLAEDALVYLEQESTASFNLMQSDFADQFELIKEKKAGQVLAQLFRFIG